METATRPMTTSFDHLMAAPGEFAGLTNWTISGSNVMINVYNSGPPSAIPGAVIPILPPGFVTKDNAQGTSGVRPTKIRLLCKDSKSLDNK
jgi:hypothetical protein